MPTPKDRREGAEPAALAHAVPLPANAVGTVAVCVAGAVVGGLWMALAGWLRQYRGINETISSLLLAYVAIGLFKHLVITPRNPFVFRAELYRARDALLQPPTPAPAAAPASPAPQPKNA